jgi:NAD(P)H-dependent nitrite reductase small subunit
VSTPAAGLNGAWKAVCALEDVLPETGVAALIEGQQVAIFRVRDAVHAIGNHDPASDCNVLARGVVGDLEGQIVVASPIYKHHFSLITGQCLEDAALRVPTYLTHVIDGHIWLRAKPTAAVRAGRRRLVVVGNGVAARATLEELLELAPNEYEISIFDAEPQGGYNRVLLSALLAGEKRREELVTHPAQWYAERKITLHAGDAIAAVDRARRRVRSSKGIELTYDRLLLATGSQPRMPQIPGSDLPGVVAFRTLEDVDAMLAVAREHQRAIVIGGGLLGLEAASGLGRRGMSVTVLHTATHLMEQQLDAQAGALVQAELASRGIDFVLGGTTTHILGEARVSGVRLADQRELAADLVVVATGVRPNIGLAQRSGLACERGVLVDDTMLTYDPAVYAVGECVQHRGHTFGVVAPLWQQARVCAAHLAERGARRYRGMPLSAQLKVDGMQVFSAGECSAGPGRETLTLRDPIAGVYKRLVLERDRLCGAVLYGDTQDGAWYLDLIEQRRDVSGLREQLLIGASAIR